MITVWAPDGIGEVRPGADLAETFLGALAEADRVLLDGDVVLVTSKVVSKAEGRARRTTREEAIADETVRVVATRGPTRIVRNRLGLTMAAAGIDASNVEAGTVLLLPEDPDGSASALRRELRERSGANVGVVITDTAGRAWREGQTDIAIGAAGLRVLDSFAGRTDSYGNPLAVTAPAVADQLAGAAELAQGKLGSRPFAVVRGRPDLVLGPGLDGPGARALVRPEGADMFGYGAREAVVRALRGRAEDRAPFGAPATPEELGEALLAVLGTAGEPAPGGLSVAAHGPVLAALAMAHGWQVADANAQRCLLQPVSP